MSDTREVADYLRKYNAWRRGDDERTMDEAGIVPEELGHMIDSAAELLEGRAQGDCALRARINHAINAVAGNKCSGESEWSQGVNAATDAHADTLRAMFADIYADARTQGDSKQKPEKEEFKGGFPLNEESLIREGDEEPVAYAAVNRIDKSAIAGLFQTEGMAGLGAQQCGGDVRPLVFGDTHPPKAQAVPEGFVLMPESITAENGAKYCLSGEFHEVVELECTACDGDDEDCDACSGGGSYTHRVPVSWTTIKDIYSAAINLLAAPRPPQEGSGDE